MYQLTLDLRPIKSWIKGKLLAGKEFRSLTVQENILLI